MHFGAASREYFATASSSAAAALHLSCQSRDARAVWGGIVPCVGGLGWVHGWVGATDVWFFRLAEHFFSSFLAFAFDS